MKTDSLYNENYYKFCCGELPYDHPAWLPFFESIADHIVKEINPQTVLDVGCAMGHLVTALRERGVEAYGIDISEYAISKVKETSKPYCRVYSALDGLPEDFPPKFDLLTTIEVIEHIREENCDQFISNICSYADRIIFSSTPDDVWEHTHYNVQQLEYWAKRFAKHGFLRDLKYSCQYISKQAVCFNRSDNKLIHVVEDYERYLRQGEKAFDDQKKKIEKELDQANLNRDCLQKKYTELADLHAVLKDQYGAAENKLTQVTEEYTSLKDQYSATENKLTQVTEEYTSLKDQYSATENKLTQVTEEYTSLKDQYSTTEINLAQVTEAYTALKDQQGAAEIEYEKLTNECNKLSKSAEEQACLIRQLEEDKKLALMQVDAKQGEIYFLCNQVREREGVLAAINNSRGYRLLQRYYQVRNRLIPRGTKRFILAKILFKMPRYIQMGYPIKMIRYIFQNGFVKTKKKIREVVLEIPQYHHEVLPLNACVYKGIGSTHSVPAHSQSVDIIICVHNAYEDVKRCIESVFEFSSWPYNVILVDDGSAELTRDYLRGIAEHCPNVKLIRNEKGKGYTYAANIGLRASSADYCILLNSDTIVTENWLDKMIDCAQSDPRIGVVGPLSNTASWQSIPEVLDEDGDWCHNKLPKGITVEQFGKMVEQYSGQLYFHVPLLNGFCLMINRKVINSIGYFDEETFGPGFGEEDDYNLRVGKAGFKLAVADNTYIFHAQSKSYSDERRKKLCEQSGKRLRQKHGDAMLDTSVHLVHKSRIFEGVRARTTAMLEREQMIQLAREKWEGKRILFILPIADAGGGGNVIIQEAAIMMKMGIDVCLYTRRELKPFFEAAYPDLEIPVIYGDKLEDFRKYAGEYDAICSTLFTSVKYCNIPDVQTKMVYYVQDYEPYFFKENSKEYKEAKQSYTIVPNMIRVTKTQWNAQEVKKHHNVDCTIIGPSVNIDCFRPRKHFPDANCIKIAAMVRPSSQRRAPEETMSILREIEKKYQGRVKILIFGADPEHDFGDREFFAKVKTDFAYEMLGKLNPMQMSELLADSEIFVDFSTFQAMGLTAMEAMASGCVVVVPQAGGADTFARHNENALVIDTSNHKACVEALDTLIREDQLRERLACAGIRDMCNYSPEHSAFRFLTAVFESEEA